MTSMSRILSVAAAVTVICGGTALVVHGDEPHHQLPAPADGKSKVVGLCDGETSVTVPDVAPGERMDAGTARRIADELMNKYDEKLRVAHGGSEHTQRETRVWEAELKRVIDEGYRLFHSNELGTNGISCDMCHPDANITHPETYPKFQTQLKKVALLRDMINWCIENPVKGKALPDDSRTMRALEAYILSQRQGEKLDIGKH